MSSPKCLLRKRKKALEPSRWTRRAAARLAGGHAGQQRGQLDVVRDGEVGDQVEELEHEADLAAAQPGPTRLAGAGQALADGGIATLPFPPITKAHIMNCSYHSWHPRYICTTYGIALQQY